MLIQQSWDIHTISQKQMFNNQSWRCVPLLFWINRQFPLGIQGAACARVGNALGAGDTQRALLVTKISLSLSCQSHTSCFCGLNLERRTNSFTSLSSSHVVVLRVHLPGRHQRRHRLHFHRRWVSHLFWQTNLLNEQKKKVDSKISSVTKEGRRFGVPSAQRLLLRPAVRRPSGECGELGWAMPSAQVVPQRALSVHLLRLVSPP